MHTAMTDDVLTSAGAPLLRADEIAWILPPVPRIETADLHSLSVRELVTYVHDLRHDLAILRALLHEALTALERSTAQNQRYHARLHAIGRRRRGRATIRRGTDPTGGRP
jgi:hypothetical protein